MDFSVIYSVQNPRILVPDNYYINTQADQDAMDIELTQQFVHCSQNQLWLPAYSRTWPHSERGKIRSDKANASMNR